MPFAEIWKLFDLKIEQFFKASSMTLLCLGNTSLNLDNFIPSTAGIFLPRRATREDAPGCAEKLRTERYHLTRKRPWPVVLPRPGAVHNDTPVAPHVRRGGRAQVAITRPLPRPVRGCLPAARLLCSQWHTARSAPLHHAALSNARGRAANMAYSLLLFFFLFCDFNNPMC